jgi:hypothetical protein
MAWASSARAPAAACSARRLPGREQLGAGEMLLILALSWASQSGVARQFSDTAVLQPDRIDEFEGLVRRGTSNDFISAQTPHR